MITFGQYTLTGVRPEIGKLAISGWALTKGADMGGDKDHQFTGLNRIIDMLE
jgi:hypothetical protein